jgi:hypothetical protein
MLCASFDILCEANVRQQFAKKCPNINAGEEVKG